MEHIKLSHPLNPLEYLSGQVEAGASQKIRVIVCQGACSAELVEQTEIDTFFACVKIYQKGNQ